MRTRLWHKTGLSKFRAERKGFSSIVGAIFMVIIVWILASGYFIYTLSQNTVYNEAIREKNLLESNALSESVQVTNTTYRVNANDKVNVSANVTNVGSLSVQFTTLWAYASNSTYNGTSYAQLLPNVNVRGGANLSLSYNVTVQGLRLGSAYSFSSWLITGRGNVVPLQKASSSYTSIVTSNTTQGIGALMMDFQNFNYYNVTQPGSSYILSGYPQGAPGYFVRQGGLGIAFQVNFTNVDPDMRNITLTAPSVLFSMFPETPQQIRAAYWYIVNVDASGTISNTFTPVALPYNVPTAIFFASKEMISGSQLFVPSSSVFTKTAPVNLALIGTIGSSAFGQNIPFVSIYINN